jgi:NhaP-type Na+/H+ or K+/H+ antiporter
MDHTIIYGLASIVVFGLLAHWLSWRFQMPAILLLLAFGVVAGPVTGLLSPDEIFGEALFPFVNIAVAIILFEGGLTLKFSEMREAAGATTKLVAIGGMITWATATGAALLFLDFPFAIALLLGAVLVVTGPTVIVPLLRQIRPTGNTYPVAKWEGIVNDPLGVMLAILVFEAALAEGAPEAMWIAVAGVLKTVFIGGGLGVVVAKAVEVVFGKRLLPDYLQIPFALTMVVAVFVASDAVQAESGLFAVTVMGVYLANQKRVSMRRVVEFKENLQPLLLSALFIVLAARLDPSALEVVSWNAVGFVGALVVVSRPAAVFLSTIGEPLTIREKIFLSLLAPRGIVAAAIGAIFSIQLAAAGFENATALEPLLFFVVASSIVLYGLGATLSARGLGVASPDPQGCLIVGADRFSRAVAKALTKLGFETTLVDNNRENVNAAKMEGLRTHFGNALSENIVDELNLGGMGKLLAMTPNNEVNSLAALHFSKIFHGEAFQINVGDPPGKRGAAVAKNLRGQILFGEEYTCDYLRERYEREEVEIRVTRFTEEYDYERWRTENAESVPLFLATKSGKLRVFSLDNKPKPSEGDSLIALRTKRENGEG